MLFPTFEFLLIFFPIVFLLHERGFISYNLTWQLVLLTVASLIFSSVWEMRSFYIIFGMLLANLLVIHFLIKNPTKPLFIAGVLVNILPLIYFKYTNFILSNLGIQLAPKDLENLHIASLPLAISFYSFVALTYIVDTYKKKITQHSPLNYSFFVTFFPHLIAGPIVHHSDLIPQIGTKKDRAALFYEGLIYLVLGFCKKIFIADPIGTFVDKLYTNAATDATFTFFESLSATLGYTFQIYFDFSGYSDMAVGLGLMLGYRLPLNFVSPYKSTSITDFWRRWHITLSRLMRDYIYFGLGGNRKGKFRQCVNVLVTMLVSGLWHGAGWTFILWGGLHGLILVVEKIGEQVLGKVKFKFKLPTFTKIFFTFVLINLLWILFRAENLDIAKKIYLGLFQPTQLGSFNIETWKFLFLASFLILLPNSHAITKFIITHKRSLASFFWENARKAALGCLLGVALCFTSLYLFYNTSWDRKIYAELPIERFSQGIDNKRGDYRSNLFASPIFAQEGAKIAIVGSSFTGDMGHFSFINNDQEFHSSTVGMGGNKVAVGLRSATAILGTPELDVLILGISPINFGKMAVDNVAPFKDQLYEGFSLIGLEPPSTKKFSSAQPVNLSLFDLFSLFARPEKRVQFREFIFKTATAFNLASFNNKLWTKDIVYIPYTPEPADNLTIFSQKHLQPFGELPKDIQNGSNDRIQIAGRKIEMKWKERGIIESLQPEAECYQAIVNLSKACESKGIRFILYTTPTVSHKDAPNIYPEGFYEAYQAAVLKMTNENKIEYYDFSFAYPWDKAYMNDFIHPATEARKTLHKYLISIISKGATE